MQVLFTSILFNILVADWAWSDCKKRGPTKLHFSVVKDNKETGICGLKNDVVNLCDDEWKWEEVKGKMKYQVQKQWLDADVISWGIELDKLLYGYAWRPYEDMGKTCEKELKVLTIWSKKMQNTEAHREIKNSHKQLEKNYLRHKKWKPPWKYIEPLVEWFDCNDDPDRQQFIVVKDGKNTGLCALKSWVHSLCFEHHQGEKWQ